MEREARGFAIGMRDPHAPDFCAACLLCFLDYLKPDVQKDNLRILRANHHDFWRGVMFFLSTKRTATGRDSAQRRLLAKLRACPAVRADHASYAEIFIRRDHLLYRVVALFFDFANRCLQSISVRNVLTQRFSSRGLWPCTADDLLLPNPQDNFTTWIYWLSVVPDSTVYSALETIMLICSPELHDLFMLDANRRMFVKALCVQLDASTAQLLRPGGIEAVGTHSARTRIAHLVLLLFSVSNSPASKLGDAHRLIRGMEDEVERSLLRARDAVPDTNTKTELARLAIVALESRGTLPSQFPPDLQRLYVETHQGRGDSLHKLFGVLLGARDRRTCAAPGCGRHEHEVGRHLNRCASCGVVRYCAKACQKLHWKAETSAHKAVCPILARLSPLLEGTSDEFASACRTVSVDDVAVVYDHVRGHIFDNDGRTTPERIAHIKDTLQMFDEVQNMTDPARVVELMSAMQLSHPTGTLPFLAK